ncbi:MAG: GntR family transcriptional regulator [Acidimicrobiia bacterium]|nr:GntR family transcriptional regulator [Acidimicrobiia bacterium]
MRETRYQQIAAALRTLVAGGDPGAGRLFPSETDLGRDYGASRVTVRRALELLRDEGLVDSRQGYGWFVAAAPVAQSLGRLGTIEAQLTESGRRSERRVLDFRFTGARAHVRKVLGADRVLEVRRMNLVDGVPFARVTVWCPSRLAAHLSLADVERETFHDLLDVDLVAATQTIAADALSEADADVLGVPAGSPALVCERVTWSADRVAVLLSEHVFPAHLTRFEVELTSVDRSVAPSGLRLLS